MAKKEFGKLKFKTSENGLAFRFGNSKVFRIGRGASKNDSEIDENMYEDDYRGEEDYTDYDDRDYGREDDYDDRYGEDYTDESEDDGYDSYEDDGRDYDDRDSGDYDDDYDDRYSGRDADDYGDDYASDNPVMRYLEEEDWPTYLLLILLPPLGVWLLWHRRRFDPPIRYAISGASILWFIVVLVILLSGILSGSGDTTVSGNITMTTPQPTVVIETTIEPDIEGSMGELTDPEGAEATAVPLDIQLGVSAAPSATALAGANGAVSANSVYMTQTGAYYHNNVSCTDLNAEGNSVSTVTTDVAIERGKSPCPICYPDQKLFYTTEKGKYYHTEQDCSGMKDATTITEEAAKAKGKKQCPVCITGELQSLGNVKYIDQSTKDRSGIYVYATDKGKYFHVVENCSGMANPKVMGLGAALLAGKEACPTCSKSAATGVWCTKGGKYYHNRSDCNGMEGAYKISLGEALVLGKKRCTTCWGNSTGGVFTSDVNGSTATTLSTASDGSAYVYATQGGTYFHTNSTCSGMSGASRLTLKQALAAGKKACPTCASGAAGTAYVTPKGTYYHSDPGCSGMRNATQTTVAQAMADGKKKCPTCWGGTGEGNGSFTTVYATKGGKYYHTEANCSGMSGASSMTLAQAVKAGKTACPTCASAANRKVYSTDSGKYYHSKSNCSGMTGAKERTLEQAILRGQTACPDCIGDAMSAKIIGTGHFSKGKSGKNRVSGISTGKLPKSARVGGGTTVSHVTSSVFSKSMAAAAKTVSIRSSAKLGAAKSAVISSLKNGTSGVKVYAKATGNYYHINRTCAGAGASSVSLETALKYGKTACPKCASTAGRTVYAAPGGKHYHYYKAHAGAGATAGKLSYALAMGLDACPTCVKYTKAKIAGKNSGSYKPGTSGVKVYATITGKYYHVNRTCAGASAAHISLETALNYGKKACPDCSSLAKKTVYASAGNKYYHSSKSHAGGKAYSGTLAGAMAAGLKPCPVCIMGSEAYEASDIKYSASGDTAVYVDLHSDLVYYHRTSKCGAADMKDGTRVQLEFVLHWNYKACPFCNPPTSVSR